MTAPSDQVAVVGAGSSTLVRELVADGYTAVTAIDIAASALDQLRRTLGEAAAGVRLLQADVRNVELSQPVAAWHDRALFHFLVDPADQRTYALNAARSVRPGGHLVMAEFAPDGPTSCSGLDVARHSIDSLQSIFSDFELIESLERDHITPWGAAQRFLHALLRRRGA